MMSSTDLARYIFMWLSLSLRVALAQDSSKNLDQLVAAAKKQDYQAALAIGRIDSQASRAALHDVMESLAKQYGDRAYDIYTGQMLSLALARLGDQKELSRFIKSLDNTDPIAQDIAIRSARYVGGAEVVDKLLTFLDRTDQVIGVHVIAPPVALRAMETLAYLVAPSPIQPGEKVSLADIPKWKRWAETRKPNE